MASHLDAVAAHWAVSPDVEVTLEADRGRGHAGTVARIAIKGPGRGPTLGKAVGPLPLAVRATVSRAGNHQVVVQERGAEILTGAEVLA